MRLDKHSRGLLREAGATLILCNVGAWLLFCASGVMDISPILAVLPPTVYTLWSTWGWWGLLKRLSKLDEELYTKYPGLWDDNR